MSEGTSAAEKFAFLFTDIESSSVKWLRHGEAMRIALIQHDAILRRAIESAHGEVFKTAGDAFYGAFPTPENALQAALQAQREIALSDWTDVEGLAVRMAIHCGGATRRDGDYFGEALNRCARLLVLGHGGQILLSRSMAEALGNDIEGTSFPQIGRNALDDPDVIEPVHQVSAPGLVQDFPPLRDPSAVPNNLPHALPSLFGREQEIGRVQAALKRSRWVTLTGIGGIGKTRLALEVAAILVSAARGSDDAKALRTRIKDGVWFVELSSLTNGKLIPAAIAAELGIELSGTRPALAELASRLESQSLLLVLDNCEHLVDAVGQVGFVLMSECPSVLVLATSQDLVEVPSEEAIAIGELPLPPADVVTAEEALGFPAVQLFVNRATAADPGFALFDRDVAAVGEICHALDGIALAIEMAATRAPMFGISALAKRLKDRFRELEREGGGPSRHQTLRAAIDWSHDLLSRREKLLLRRTSVFAGSFSMEDATAVAGDDDLEEIELINGLAELVRRSLMVRDKVRSDPRYRLLQTVLAYAREKLDQSEQASRVEGRLLARMTDVAEEGFDRSLELADWLIRESYEADLPNIRVALDRGFAAGGDLSLAMRLAGSAQPLLLAMGLLAEARERLELASSHAAEVDDATAAKVWLGLGLALGFSNPARAVELLEHAEPYYRAAAGPLFGQLLVMKGRLAQVVAGRETQARELLAEARPLVEATGIKRLIGHMYRGLGNQRMADGRPDEGVAMMRLAEQAFREAGADGAASTVRTSLGYLLWAAGRLDEAIAQCREVLADLREQTFLDETVLGFVLGNIAGMLTERGDLDEASQHLSEAAPLLRDPWQIWVIFDHVAYFFGKAGELERAARASGFTDRQYAEHAASRQPNEARAHQLLQELFKGAIPDEQLNDLKRVGAGMSEDEAVTLAASAADVISGKPC